MKNQTFEIFFQKSLVFTETLNLWKIYKKRFAHACLNFTNLDLIWFDLHLNEKICPFKCLSTCHENLINFERQKIKKSLDNSKRSIKRNFKKLYFFLYSFSQKYFPLRRPRQLYTFNQVRMDYISCQKPAKGGLSSKTFNSVQQYYFHVICSFFSMFPLVSSFKISTYVKKLVLSTQSLFFCLCHHRPMQAPKGHFFKRTTPMD